jgi:hypothetical protein
MQPGPDGADLVAPLVLLLADMGRTSARIEFGNGTDRS